MKKGSRHAVFLAAVSTTILPVLFALAMPALASASTLDSQLDSSISPVVTNPSYGFYQPLFGETSGHSDTVHGFTVAFSSASSTSMSAALLECASPENIATESCSWVASDDSLIHVGDIPASGKTELVFTFPSPYTLKPDYYYYIYAGAGDFYPPNTFYGSSGGTHYYDGWRDVCTPGIHDRCPYSLYYQLFGAGGPNAAPVDFIPSTTHSTILASQLDHSQVVRSEPGVWGDNTYHASMQVPLTSSGTPLFWWLYANIANPGVEVFSSASSGLRDFGSCRVYFDKTNGPGWVRSYATNCSWTAPALPAGTIVQLHPLGLFGQGTSLYGGAATSSQGIPYACLSTNTGVPTETCTAMPAFFVSESATDAPEGAPIPYQDSATHLVAGQTYSTFRFTAADSPYVIDGPVYFQYGTVTVEPGAIIKFRNQSSSLTIHANTTFVSLATKENPAFFTSYKDDTHGGDTNGDGAASQPGPGDWGYLELGCGSIAFDYQTSYIRVYYGGAQSKAGDQTAALRFCLKNSTWGLPSTIALENVEVAHNLGGVLLYNNSTSGYLRGSSIHDNTLFGVQVMQYETGSTDLSGNWWGSASGPRVALNPSGTGDSILTDLGKEYMTIHAPWLTEDPFAVPIVQAVPSIANLAQFREFGIDPIEPGAGFIGNAVVLKAEVNDADSAQVTLEVELKPAGTPFDGSNLHATSTSVALGATSTISIPIDELISLDDQYSGNNHQAFHWRARAVDAEGHPSEWVEYAPAADSFTANVVPLWTQVQSSYPSLASTTAWAGKQYASTSCSISACGCGIASITMIARYYGIATDLDGKSVDLDNANTWLKNNDGYAPGGLIRWNVIAEKYLGIRQPDGIYRRLSLSGFRISPTLADAELSDLKPVIARKETAGHFFVVSSKVAKETKNTYLVNDPGWYNTRTLDDARASFVRPYGNSYDYAIVYSKLDTPTKVIAAANADLYLASPAELLITDPQGRREGLNPTTGTTHNEIPGALYYKEGSYESSNTDVDPLTQHYIKVLHLPLLPDGSYTIKVIGTGEGSYALTSVMTTDAGTTIQKTFTASTTPNQVTDYQLVVSNGVPAISRDTTSPEASVSFSTTTKSIVIAGTDDQSVPTVVTGAISSVITDASGNTLTLNLAQNVKQANYASLTIPSFRYSSGTSTLATTSLRYFWATDRAGKYTLLISAIRTPTGRQIAIYTALLGKTYVVSSTAADDTADLSLQSALLLLRSKIKTYTGLYIPHIETQRGSVHVK